MSDLNDNLFYLLFCWSLRRYQVEKAYIFRSPPVAEFAHEIAEALRGGRRSLALRTFIQLNDNLHASDLIRKQDMAINEPPLTGHEGYDALIAGIVEYYFIGSKLPLPEWVNNENRSLPLPWYFEEFPLDKEDIEISTPECFAHRNVYIRESELMSV